MCTNKRDELEPSTSEVFPGIRDHSHPERHDVNSAGVKYTRESKKTVRSSKIVPNLTQGQFPSEAKVPHPGL